MKVRRDFFSSQDLFFSTSIMELIIVSPEELNQFNVCDMEEHTTVIIV